MRSLTRGLLLAPLLLGALSCGEPTSAKEDVEVYLRSLNVVVRNNADEPLYSMILDQQSAALIDWIPCVEESCGRIAPSSSRFVTAESLGTSLGDTVLVYTWRRTSGPLDEPIAGPITLRKIRLVWQIDP